MKKTVKISLIAMALLSVVITGLLFYARSGCKVQVKCDYMRYACGDCYPQYNVSRVISGGCNLKLLDQDISLEFGSPEMSERFETEVPPYVLFPSYTLKGIIRYSLWRRHYILTVSEYVWLKPNNLYEDSVSFYSGLPEEG